MVKYHYHSELKWQVAVALVALYWLGGYYPRLVIVLLSIIVLWLSGDKTKTVIINDCVQEEEAKTMDRWCSERGIYDNTPN